MISCLTAVRGVTVNFDFNVSPGGNYTGIGVAPDSGTFWNSGLIPASSPNLLVPSVKDSQGTTLSGFVIFLREVNSTPIKGSSQATLGNPNPLLLMQDYTNGGSYELVLGGLSPGNYLLYVFAHGEQPEQNSTVTLNAANGGASATTVATGSTYRDLFAVGAEGNAYLKFDNVPVGTDGVLRFTTGSYFNGFQIVEKVLPIITSQPPATVSAFFGLNATIQVTASGPASMTYQWQMSADSGATFTDIDPGQNPSAATNNLMLTHLDDEDAGLYRVIISTIFGSVTSDSSELSIETNPGPLFALHPQSQLVDFGQPVTLSSEAFAPSGVSYQWYQDGDLIPGATNSSYSIDSLTLADIGTYTVVASNAFGSLASEPATLTLRLPSFPGADGPGADATGGRGGEVYHVTNLDDDINNPPVGSLRYGLKNVPPQGRTIVFDISGLIFLDPASTTTGWLKSGESNLTIAGQTAPYPGITIAGQGTKFSGSNVIIRHLKIRPGKHQMTPGISTHDGISNYLQHSIIDHVSISWADDEALSSTDLVDTTTVQYCIISEGLYYDLDGGKTHAYGALINSEVSDAPLSYHHNLFAHVQSRLPRIQNEVDSGSTGAILNWSNNVIYNWLGNAGYTGVGESTRSNFIGNYYISGPNTRTNDRTFYSPDTATQFYIVDNYRDVDKDGILDGTDPGASVFVGGTFLQVGSPFPQVDIPYLDTPGTSVETVTSRAGAFWWDRDAVDTRAINDTLNQTGQFVADPSDVGGWDQRSNARPNEFDRDRDGMSDAWEIAHGLNPLVVNHTGDINGDGYSNLQNYLNDLGAFPLLSPPSWHGGDDRFASPGGWNGAWQPSRFDSVYIGSGTATVDSAGSWAGNLHLDPDAADTAALSVVDGWLHVAGNLETGGTGDSVIDQSGGLVRIEGTLRLESASGNAQCTVSGGVLYAGEINVGNGGYLSLAGGTLHTRKIIGSGINFSGGRLAPGTSSEIEILAASLGDRALVPPVDTTTGTTEVIGDLDLSDATLEIGLEADERADRLVVTGQLILGGPLSVVVQGGFKPALGSQYVIAQAGSLVGTFSHVPDGFAISQSATGAVLLTYIGNILTFDDWAAELPFASPEDSLPGSDPDFDGWNNLNEFAFDGDPLVADRPQGLPEAVQSGTGAILIESGFPLLRFAHRQSSDLSYFVEVSGNLVDWSSYWATSDGWGATVVVSRNPGLFFDEVTLDLSQASQYPLFVRIRAELNEELQLLAPLGLTGAVDVPPDIPPSLVFNRSVTAGTSGTIRLYKADGTLVSTIDLAANPQRWVGNDRLYYRPVTVDANVATVLFDRNLMAYGTTYYVTLDAGVIRDAEGNSWQGVSDDQTLRFTTRASGPSSSDPLLSVNQDGTGDFCTVQGALEHIGNLLPDRVTIEVANGSYEELIYVSNQRGPITIRGESRQGTVIHYANNANYNPISRASFRNRAHDLTVENLTLINTTPKGGSQAEAFMSQGSRIVVRNCSLSSFQDTIRVDKSCYFENCYIEGDVDYFWGDGVAYMDRCIVHNLDGGYIVQARNEESGHGFIFKECLLTADPGVNDTFLARIAPAQYPFSEVVFLNCAMGSHIEPVGWLLNSASSAPDVRFYEYASTDLDGVPLDVSSRLPDSTQLSPEQAAPFLDPRSVLGFDPGAR